MSNKLLLLTISSHNFKVTRISPNTKLVVDSFARRYIQRGMVKQQGRFVTEAVKVFAAATSDREEYRFHINQLKDFYEHLKFNHITENLYEIIINPIKPGIDIELKVKDKWVTRDYQIPIVEYLVETNWNKAKLVGIQTGRGKATRLDAKIKIPGGWSTMGEMYVGKKIIAKDGSTTEVTAIHPQGKLQMYKVTFADGRNIECCAEHLWKVYYINTTIQRRWQVVNTLEVLRLISMPNPRVYIDLIDPEDSKDLDLPIDPYVLGLILGDGSITQNSISITKNDEFIFDEIRKVLPSTLKLVLKNTKVENKCICYGISRVNNTIQQNTYVVILRSLDLMGKGSHEKFIPKQYLEGSYKQRLSILQGLLDTDGYCGLKHHGASIEYSTSSEQLALDVQYLVRSIGGITNIRSRSTHYVCKGKRVEARTNYRMTIQVKTPSILFRLPRKKERTNDEGQYTDSLKLKVISIVPTTIEEAQCISISHPDKLYVTDDFIVTHNTFTALQALSILKKRTVIIIKPMFIEKWIDDIKKTYDDIEIKDIMVVKGSAHLMSLLDQAESNELTCKFIIISNKTIQNWLKIHERYRDGAETLGYTSQPETLFEDLGCGVRLIDEVHMDFHLCFKIDLYTHIERSISLSATLVSNDDFVAKMHEIMHPSPTRYADQKLNQYINSYVVYYNFQDPTKVRTTEYGQTNYSHTALEKSIYKHKPTLNNYLNLINYTIQIGFVKNPRPKKKLLIFASTIDMCGLIADYLQRMYPEYNVKRYVAEDPYEENLMNSDICVSTLGSAGTAVDIPNLTNVILTVAVDSIQSNIQSLGRLRQLGPDDKTEFHYFTCLDFPKHLEYSYRKKEMLGRYAKTFAEVYSRHIL